MKKIENLRTDYKLDQLNESSLAPSPMVQFELWFNEVLDSIIEPTAMVLSTYSQKKGVNSRVVLLKELKKDGFVFYTNYNSLKAEQIKQNPYVSYCFFGQIFKDRFVYMVWSKKLVISLLLIILKKDPGNLKLRLGLLLRVL